MRRILGIALLTAVLLGPRSAAGDRHRDDRVAGRLTALLKRQRISLSQAVKPLGLSARDVRRLAHGRPELRAQIARCRRHPGYPKTAPQLDLKAAREIGLTRSNLASHLSSGNSKILDKVYGEIDAFRRRYAIGKQPIIEPRHLEHADKRVKALLETIYRQDGVGRRTLTLEEIRKRLPEAVAAVAAGGASSSSAAKAWAPLYVELTEEIAKVLAADYRTSVVDGEASRDDFWRHRGLRYKSWQTLFTRLDAHFPRPDEVPLTRARIDTAAKLYRDLKAKKITMVRFARKTALGSEQLHLLQLLDRRFAKSERSGPRAALPNVHELYRPGSNAHRALSLAYKDRVVPGKQTVRAFCKQQRISEQKLGRLRDEDPEAFPRLRELFTSDNARRVGQAAKKVFDGDVLVQAKDIVAALNRDRALLQGLGVALEGGKLSKKQYDIFRGKARDIFPDLTDAKPKNRVLVPEVQKLIDAGLSNNQLLAEMQKKHPRFSKSRLSDMQRKGLVSTRETETRHTRRRTGAERERDARALAAALARTERKTIPEAINVLVQQKSSVRRDPQYLWALRRQFPDLFKAQQSPTKALAASATRMRNSAAIAERLALLIRVAPPGLAKPEVARALDRILAEQGLEPYGQSYVNFTIDKYISRKYGSMRMQYAKVVSEIVAEYARVAKRGASTEAVIEAMIKPRGSGKTADYPTIRRRQMTYWMTEWQKHPERYPALAKFFEGGKLKIVGRGERVAKGELRYVGGWDVERALLAPSKRDKRLAAELAVRSQYARIPARLPMLDEMVGELKGKQPLAHHHVLWVTHLLGTMVPMADALRQAGMNSRDSIIVGTPYGSNMAVRTALRNDGFKNVWVPRLRPGALRAKVEKAVDQMMERLGHSSKSVVVLDDGGMVAEILHTKYADAKYRERVNRFKIVEQTTRGVTNAQRFALHTPLIAVNAARAKVEGEAVFIGRAVAAKVAQGLRRVGADIRGKLVVVNGYGPIGEATARAARAQGAEVVVIDSSSAACKRAETARDSAGRALFSVIRTTDASARAKALSRAQVVLGCTGRQSLTLADFKRMRDGVIVASTSSADVETARDDLAAHARRERLRSTNPLVRLPTVVYTLGRKRITLLGDGWPVNFDGDVEDIAPRQIQITRALMFAGALQAVRINSNDRRYRKVLKLDPAVDRRILGRFRQIEAATRDLPIGDPARWADDVRRMATLLRH